LGRPFSPGVISCLVMTLVRCYSVIQRDLVPYLRVLDWFVLGVRTASFRDQ
jgi:hypothetical protein